MTNAIDWFEIPAKDLSRAKKFYSTILNVEVNDFPMPGPIKYAIFPFERPGGIGGVIACGEGSEPSAKGALLYLNAGEDLAVPLSKIENAGGKVLMPKTPIGEFGFIAHFLDCEGNKVALHSKG